MSNEQAMADAAAALTASFIGSPVEQEAVEPVEATTEVVEQPAAEVTEVAESAAPVATFELNPTLPDDIAQELAEADIDDEVERAVAALEPTEDEWGNEVPVDTDAERERIKLRKRNEYLEQQLVQAKAGSWKKEAEQFFPLSKHALDDIKASSRRGFLKAAKAEHDRIVPHVQAYLAEAKQFADSERVDATAAARTEVAAAWGQPVAGPDSGLTDTAAHETRIQAARKTGRLADVFAAMMNERR